MDTAVRKVSIAEHARHAAEIAAATLEHATNPYPEGSDEYLQWQAAYTRWVDAFTTGEETA